MHNRTMALLLLTAVGLGAGCTSKVAPADLDTPPNAQVIQLDSDNMAFSARTFEVKKGQPVKLVLRNKDGSLHDFAIDKIRVSDVKTNADRTLAPKADLYVSARAGQQGALLFTPTEAGEYTFYCTVPGHQAAGMQGKLIVRD